jgi:hypothetical protein
VDGPVVSDVGARRLAAIGVADRSAELIRMQFKSCDSGGRGLAAIVAPIADSPDDTAALRVMHEKD